MLGVYLSIVLLSTTGSDRWITPEAKTFAAHLEPTLGFASALAYHSIDHTDTSYRYSHRKTFLDFALPYKGSVLDPGDFLPVRLIWLNELLYHPALFVLNWGVGPEMKVPFGYHSQPSSIFFGGQGGVYYSMASDNKYDSMSFIDRNSLAALLNLYFGPEFDIYDKFAFKVQFNPKIMIGKIAEQTIRIPGSSFIGMIIAINFQFEFL